MAFNLYNSEHSEIDEKGRVTFGKASDGNSYEVTLRIWPSSLEMTWKEADRLATLLSAAAQAARMLESGTVAMTGPTISDGTEKGTVGI